MAFLDHIDPGNAGGSVPVPERIRYYKEDSGPSYYVCPFCDHVFTDVDDRDKHRVEAHPIRRPVLFIKGQFVRTIEAVITEALSEGDLSFSDTDSVNIGPEIMDVDEASRFLTGKTSGFFDVHLWHRGYEVTHKLHFRVVDQDVLRSVEDCFYDSFSTKLGLAAQLSVFDDKLGKVNDTGRHYAGGLGSYISGLMIKEGLQPSLPDSIGYLEKIGEAQDKLACYRRPLAQSILAIIDFIRNDFRPRPGDSFLPSLALAKAVFRTGTFVRGDQLEEKGNSEIPIDSASESIVDAALYLLATVGPSLIGLQNLYQAKTVSEDDRQKALFLLWLNAKNLGITEARKEYERELKYCDGFKKVVTAVEGNQ